MNPQILPSDLSNAASNQSPRALEGSDTPPSNKLDPIAQKELLAPPLNPVQLVSTVIPTAPIPASKKPKPKSKSKPKSTSKRPTSSTQHSLLEFFKHTPKVSRDNVLCYPTTKWVINFIRRFHRTCPLSRLHHVAQHPPPPCDRRHTSHVLIMRCPVLMMTLS